MSRSKTTAPRTSTRSAEILVETPQKSPEVVSEVIATEVPEGPKDMSVKTVQHVDVSSIIAPEDGGELPPAPDDKPEANAVVVENVVENPYEKNTRIKITTSGKGFYSGVRYKYTSGDTIRTNRAIAVLIQKAGHGTIIV
jgi:hypothetical protein